MKQTLKPGDEVQLMEPFRSSRLNKNSNDFVANGPVTVETVYGGGRSFSIRSRPEVWIADCFELAGGPW